MTTTANWTLLPATSNARGQRSAPILCDNAVLKVKLEPTYAPFGAGTFGGDKDAVRLNLDLACTDTYAQFLQLVDKWVIDQLAANPTNYFKKALKREEIEAQFKPSTTPHAKNGVDYNPTVRCKINLAGPYQVKCWNPDKTLRGIPEDWRQCTITPEITVKSIWFMNGACGVVYEIHNCMVTETDQECPF